MTSPDDAVLAGLVRRVFADPAAYVALQGDAFHPERGMGLSLKASLDLTQEEWNAVTNAWGWEADDENDLTHWHRAERAEPPAAGG